MKKKKETSRGPLRDPYITVTALAKRWDASRQVIIALIDEGRLEGLKIRGVHRISSHSVIRFEAEERKR